MYFDLRTKQIWGTNLSTGGVSGSNTEDPGDDDIEIAARIARMVSLRPLVEWSPSAQILQPDNFGTREYPMGAGPRDDDVETAARIARMVSSQPIVERPPANVHSHSSARRPCNARTSGGRGSQ